MMCPILARGREKRRSAQLVWCAGRPTHPTPKQKGPAGGQALSLLGGEVEAGRNCPDLLNARPREMVAGADSIPVHRSVEIGDSSTGPAPPHWGGPSQELQLGILSPRQAQGREVGFKGLAGVLLLIERDETVI